MDKLLYGFSCHWGGTHRRDLAEQWAFEFWLREGKNWKRDSSWALMVWGNSQQVGQSQCAAMSLHPGSFSVSSETASLTIQETASLTIQAQRSIYSERVETVSRCFAALSMTNFLVLWTYAIGLSINSPSFYLTLNTKASEKKAP